MDTQNTLTLAELEAQSRKALNTDTDMVHYEGLTNYEGATRFEGDDLISFDPTVGGRRGPKYTIRLVNANASTRYAVLCPGLNESLTGVIATGAFNDRDGNAGLTGSGNPGTIEMFRYFFRRVPSQLLQLKVQSTDATQVEQTIEYQRQSPFRTLQNEFIVLATHQDENTYKDKVVTVNTLEYQLQFDDQTYIVLPVVGSSTCTLTLQFGATANLSAFLNKKVKKALAGA